MAKASAKPAAKSAAPKAPKGPKAPTVAAAAPATPPAVSDSGPGADPVAVEAMPAGRAREDVVHFCYDNDHKHGVHCTLTFADGATAEAVVPKTSSLAADQAAASAAALESAA